MSKKKQTAQRDAAKAPLEPVDPFFRVEDGIGGDSELSTGMKEAESDVGEK